MGALPSVKEATHEEVLYFVEHNNFMGKGVGYVDVHLLASVALTDNVFLWTMDKRLAILADKIGLALDDVR